MVLQTKTENIPTMSLQKLTAKEPIFLPAEVKAKAVNVQNNAVITAYISPMCESIIDEWFEWLFQYEEQFLLVQ